MNIFNSNIPQKLTLNNAINFHYSYFLQTFLSYTAIFIYVLKKGRTMMNIEIQSLKAGFVKIQKCSIILVITLNRFSVQPKVTNFLQLPSYLHIAEMFNTDDRKKIFPNTVDLQINILSMKARQQNWQKLSPGRNVVTIIIITIMYLYISPPNVYELLCYLHDCGQFLHCYPAGVRGHHGQLSRYTCTCFCSYPDLVCREGGMEKL